MNEEEYICECGYKTNSAYFMVRHLSEHSVKEIINNYEKKTSEEKQDENS